MLLEDSATDVIRCAWAGVDPLMQAYHDLEWGQVCHDDAELFERLTLEVFQAGLSWSTILHKRRGFRRAFDAWDVPRIAGYGAADVERLLADSGIVRNRLKVTATIRNARALLKVQETEGSFDHFVWRFAPPASRRFSPLTSPEQIPPRTEDSDVLSAALKAAGFSFVGSKVCYAFMQSVGMVDDHVASCFRARRPRAQAQTLGADTR